MDNNDMHNNIVAEIEMPNGSNGIILYGKLRDPEERKFTDIPTTIEIDIRENNTNETLLTKILIMNMSVKRYGYYAVGVMDSYDQDCGVVGIELFSRREDEYPPGNIIIWDCYGGEEPDESIFKNDFDANRLIQGIAAVCNHLMEDKSRNADYLAFYGNEYLWPPDKKWKQKLCECGCKLYEIPYHKTFIIAHKLTGAMPNYIKLRTNSTNEEQSAEDNRQTQDVSVINEGKLYIHKKNRHINFFSTDHHVSITSQVQTFYAPTIWEEINPIYFMKYPLMEVPIDIAMHEEDMHIRAFRHKDSGVMIVETGLYDYQKDKVDQNRSAFKPYNNQELEPEPHEIYHMTAKNNFMLFALDDCGRWCNGLIYIPAGTQFSYSFANEFRPKGYLKRGSPISWPMVYLRNSKIGIEIMFPEKYLSDVFDYSDGIAEIVEARTDRRLCIAHCACCGQSISMPVGAKDSVFIKAGIDLTAKGATRTYKIGEFLCDNCYVDLFDYPQKAWFYQTDEDPTPSRLY